MRSGPLVAAFTNSFLLSLACRRCFQESCPRPPTATLALAETRDRRSRHHELKLSTAAAGDILGPRCAQRPLKLTLSQWKASRQRTEPARVRNACRCADSSAEPTGCGSEGISLPSVAKQKRDDQDNLVTTILVSKALREVRCAMLCCVLACSRLAPA